MAKNSELHVGARLRSMREQRGLSLRVLAERSGLSINAISLIERGENSPTVSSLHHLADGLDVNITDFFQEEVKSSLVLVRQNQRLRSQRYGVLVESLGLGLSNQQMEPFRMVIQPDSGNLRDAVSHSGEEFIYCLDGEIEYTIGEHLVQLKRGDSLLFDATQSHGYRNRTSKQAVILMVFLAFQDPQLARQLHL